MTAKRHGAKALAEFMPDILEETLAVRGLGKASLIAHWPAIVGERIARFMRPIELRWPPRGARRDPGVPPEPATLVVRVEGVFALEAQHAADVVAARVNAHLGWRCVGKIAFRQGPLPPPRERRRAREAPSVAAESEAQAAAASIENEGLREALTRLGARAIDRSAAARPSRGD